MKEQLPQSIAPANPVDKLRSWQRFHIRLTALYGGAVFLTLILMALAFYWLSVASEVQALQQRLLAMATSLAHSIEAEKIEDQPADATEMSPFQRELLERFTEVARRDPDVESIYILRPTNEPTKLRFFVDYVKKGEAGKPGELYQASDVPVLLKGFNEPVVENEPYRDEFGLTISGYAPLLSADGRSVGVLGIDVSAGRLYLLKRNVLWLTLSLFGIAATLVGIASILVARNVREPLTRLINATAAIAQGNLHTRLSLQRKDEFGVLGRHFDQMANELQQRELIRDTFGRYVSQDVAKTLLATGLTPVLGGEERIVSVLFCDLHGYSTISERLSPVQVVELLNRYLGAMNIIIDEHRGCVIEFLGDAILAVFGAPSYFPDHAEQAVECALAMRERLRLLNDEWNQSAEVLSWWRPGFSKLEARIGIHTGPVVAGNLGSPQRMKYSVIGDSVNVAARLEELNKELNGTILISEDVRSRLSASLAAQAEVRGDFKVKGREQTVRIFAL